MKYFIIIYSITQVIGILAEFCLFMSDECLLFLMPAASSMNIPGKIICTLGLSIVFPVLAIFYLLVLIICAIYNFFDWLFHL